MQAFALFQKSMVHVVMSHGVGEIVRSHLTMGRIAQWPLEVMGIDIMYVPQTAIKSQALTNFVVEWTETQQSPALVTQEH
jgi:hypothetical protein